MVLKPQDVYVALKIAAAADRAPYSQLAGELVMSPSEVQACVQRAERSQLLHGSKMSHRPNFKGLEEFLLHGMLSRLNGENSRVAWRRRMRLSHCAT